MGKRFNNDEMQKIFEVLQESYDVYGPKIYQGTGCYSDTDVIRYGNKRFTLTDSDGLADFYKM